MTKDIHIVLSSSNEFAEYCATTMASILHNVAADCLVHFYILSFDMKDKNKQKIEKLKKLKPCSIEYPQFDENMLDMFKGIKMPPHVSKMTYARILIPDILPDVDKAIFIDSDTIVRTDISKLYDIDMDDNYFAMVEDACGKINSKKLWRDEKEQSVYFNCGLMLINAHKLRTNNYLELIKNRFRKIEINISFVIKTF